MVAGAVAGIIAMSSTYHLDMVRGRLTVQEGRSHQYKGIMHAYREIVSKVSLSLLCLNLDSDALSTLPF